MGLQIGKTQIPLPGSKTFCLNLRYLSNCFAFFSSATTLRWYLILKALSDSIQVRLDSNDDTTIPFFVFFCIVRSYRK